MSTEVRAPTAPPEPPLPTTASRGRGWLQRVFVAIALILTVALVAATLWIARYDPLANGSWRSGPPPGLDANVVDVSLAGSGVEEIFRMPARPGMTFTYSFSVANRGPVAVTIEGVGVPRAEQAGNVVTRYPVRMKVNILPGLADVPWAPFRSFTLVPGQEAMIEMRATLHGKCLEGSLAWGSEDINFRVFGIERHEMFTPDVVIELVGRSSHCPQQTIPHP